MTVRRLVWVCSVVVLAMADGVWAQIPGCGGTDQDTYIYQVSTLPRVTAVFNMSRDQNGCALMVRSEGWVHGAGSAGSAEGAYSAVFSKTVSVPNFNVRCATGKYWLIELLPPFQWHLRAEIPKCTTMSMGGGGGGGWGEGACEARDAEWGCDSPILLDTAFDGYRLTSVEEGVAFDLDGDGTAERVAWTRPDSDDAWLAMDRNGNGVIDDGRELFGNHTAAYADKAEPVSANGFEALRFTEGPSYGTSLPDSLIDQQDAVFSRLLLWRDLNHNGISEPDELRPAAEAGLSSISTDYRASRRVDRHGNEFRQRAKSRWTIDGVEIVHPVFDVWLRVDR